MIEAFDDLETAQKLKNSIIIKVGIHHGPCIAVTLNERIDYFGTTVNIAARVQGLSDGRDVMASQALFERERRRRAFLRSEGLGQRPVHHEPQGAEGELPGAQAFAPAARPSQAAAPQLSLPRLTTYSVSGSGSAKRGRPPAHGPRGPARARLSSKWHMAIPMSTRWRSSCPESFPAKPRQYPWRALEEEMPRGSAPHDPPRLPVGGRGPERAASPGARRTGPRPLGRAAAPNCSSWKKTLPRLPCVSRPRPVRHEAAARRCSSAIRPTAATAGMRSSRAAPMRREKEPRREEAAQPARAQPEIRRAQDELFHRVSVVLEARPCVASAPMRNRRRPG